MSKILRSSGDSVRLDAPMTTAQLARRMLSASAIVAMALPIGFYSAPALDILLALHAAEDEAHYPETGAIQVPGMSSPDLTNRWVNLLVDSGLIEQRGGLIALSATGHQTVIALLEQVFADQRSLD